MTARYTDAERWAAYSLAVSRLVANAVAREQRKAAQS